MRMKSRIALLVFASLLVGAGTASAQLIPWKDRGFANISFGDQNRATSDTAAFVFSLYEEDGVVSAANATPGGSFLDILAGARLFNNFGVGFQFNTRTATSTGAVAASVPDPIAYNVPRYTEATVPGLTHKERWMSLLATYMLPATDRIDVLLFGGPSVVKVDHAIVTSATITEGSTGPVVTVGSDVLSRSVWGFAAGADVRFMFTKWIGAGAFVRTQLVTVNLLPGNIKVESGGPQFGAGLRVRF